MRVSLDDSSDPDKISLRGALCRNGAVLEFEDRVISWQRHAIRKGKSANPFEHLTCAHRLASELIGRGSVHHGWAGVPDHRAASRS